MKLTHYIYISAALAMLTACQDDVANESPIYTVGEADNAIVLIAGVREGGSGVQTRAVTDPDANHDSSSNGGGHKLLTSGTYARLRVDGKWKRTSSGTAEDVRKVTTIQMGGAAAASGNDALHNLVTSYSPQLYWDDYGTADPANATEGRTRGLTIYGVAVDNYDNGGSAALPTSLDLNNDPSHWNSLAWTLVSDQKTNGYKNQDLLISNNVVYNSTDSKDNAYKFESRASGKLVEFTHAMSKITVRLIANEGFPTTGVGVTAKRFAAAPEVNLTRNKIGESNPEWVNTSCNINVTDGSFSNSGTPALIYMHEDNRSNATYTVIYDALVAPGSCFGSNDNDVIAYIKADGNVYYVTAEKIRAAITAKYGSGQELDFKTQPGINYILNVTVNKTSIDVSATIKSWEDVSAANDTPIIGFSKCYGQTTGNELTDFQRGFTFYRSTALTGSYLETGNSATVVYSTGYTMTPQLYWPDHNTHYFFRGVYPEVGSVDSNQDAIGPATTKLKPNSIEVTNAPYKANYYPSDLMIGMPRTATGDRDENCKAGHTQADGTTPMGGICATDAVAGSSHENEGLIHMNFEYAMSQVIVKLETTSDPQNSVEFNGHTEVYIVDGYEAGEIKLSDGSSDFTGKTVADFQMANDNNITGRESNDYANYRNAIIPQKLTNGTGSDAKNLKFRVIVGDGSQEDSYETVNGIKEIEVSEDGGVTKHKIDEWKPGKRYTYTLTITKTGIEVIATIKDWTDVDASENIWF